MREAIEDLFPELTEIEDQELRNKVADVWEEAIRSGGWKPEDLSRIPFTLLTETEISYLEHIRTVCRLCIEMCRVLNEMYGQRISIERDHLIAGALLADVGKMFEYEDMDGAIVKSQAGENLRHPFSGVGLCFKHGIPWEVMHVVATHSKEGDHVRRSPESIIFHHADFTDFELAQG